MNKLEFYFPKDRIDLKIKEDAKDFIVKEISEYGLVDKCSVKEEGGDFCWFVLKKQNWATDKAIKAIAKYLGVSQRRFNWAGTKDKKAITFQLCSAYKIEKEKLMNVDIKDIEILCSFYMKDKIRLGQLKGNRFYIKMSKEEYDHFKRLDKGKFPNYYGMQRFGIRENSHVIGYHIIKEEFEEAAYKFLIERNNENNPKAIEARKRLEEEGDFKKAFEYFPKHLYLERMMLNHLKDYPNDYVNAFRKMPRYTLLTFVHALQSYIFNLELSERFKEQGWGIKKEDNEYLCKKDEFGFPELEEKGEEFLVGNVVGYQTKTNSYEEEILEKLGIEKEEFRIKSFPELSSKGSRRVLLSPIVDEKYEDYLEFSLPSGSYATSMLSTFFIIS